MTLLDSGSALILLTFLVVTASPGPANLSLAATAMAEGRRSGVAMAVGLALGLAVWGVVAAIGLGAVLAASPSVMLALKVGGGLYLLWLAWKSGRAALGPPPAAEAVTQPVGTGTMLWRGLLLNLLNPKAVLAWTAGLSVGLPMEGDGGMVAGLTGLCALIGLANYLIHALVFSLGGVMEIYRRVRRWIEGVTAAFLGAAGMALLLRTRVE